MNDGAGIAFPAVQLLPGMHPPVTGRGIGCPLPHGDIGSVLNGDLRTERLKKLETVGGFGGVAERAQALNAVVDQFQCSSSVALSRRAMAFSRIFAGLLGADPCRPPR